MNIKQAITAYSQSDKIKSEIIMATGFIEIWFGLPEPERRGAEKVLRTMAAMIGSEIQIGIKLCGDTDSWKEAANHLDRAILMINSGVPQDSPFHLSKALSQITSIAQRSMTYLHDQNLL